MMKIAIMTWYQYYNYGTALQVSALSRVIEEFGKTPMIVKYKTKGYLTKKMDKYTVFSEFTKVKKKILFKNLNKKERTNLFENFYKEYLTFTNECNTLPELERLNDEFDAFVCGSDQIWAPSCFDSHYFLDFVKDENRMMSYAPSIGLPKISDRYIAYAMRNLLKRFKYISTRETSGSKIVSELIDKDVETVLDPTLLLDSKQWNEFINNDKKVNDKYLLVYMLGINSKHWKKIYQIANKLDLEVKIIPVFENDLKRKDCIKETIGPSEFLKYIKNAEYICTDSFHGTAFAINYNKNFSVFERFKSKDKNNQNSRIYNILNKLGLESRLIKESDDFKSILTYIEYNEINKQLELLRRDSLKFLYQSLDSINDYNKKRVENKNILAKNSLCCGCGACMSVCAKNAINIDKNNDGFYVASINEDKCVNCGKCLDMCPYIKLENNVKINNGTLFSYKDNEHDVLMTSSSGGAGYRIAEMLMKQDYNVVGCEFNVEEQGAKHIIIKSNNVDELSRIQGSKYIQSDFSNIVKELVLMKDKVVIFGTPCQIAASKNICNRENSVYVDLICHGVPSHNLYLKYLEYLKNKKNINGNVRTIFRNKNKGWRKINLYNTDGIRSISINQNEDPFFLMFEHGFCYSKSCFECPWRDKSAADIRLGDYWGEKYKDDKTGVSMILANTEKGKEIVLALSCKGNVKKEDIKDYFDAQQTNNFALPVFYDELMESLRSDKSILEINKEYLSAYERRKKIIKKLMVIRRLIKRNGK